MATQKVVDHLTAGIEEQEGGEELGEEENNDHYIELARGELAEDGEESGEGEVEGSQGTHGARSPCIFVEIYQWWKGSSKF